MFKRRITKVASGADLAATPHCSSSNSNLADDGNNEDVLPTTTTSASGPLHILRQYSNGVITSNGNNHQHRQYLQSESEHLKGKGKVHGKRWSSLLLVRLRLQTDARYSLWLSLLAACTCLFLLSTIQFFRLLAPSSTTEFDHPPFELESINAPVCHPLSSPQNVTFTLVTQLSDDRLWMMEHHCKRYPHPMAIAVYTNRSLTNILDELRELGCPVDDHHGSSIVPPNLLLPGKEGGKTERDDDENIEVDDDQFQPSTSHLDEHIHHSGALLQVAVLDATQHGKRDDYPVNDLRNLALSLVQSSHIIYIDVDFWPSEYLYEIFSRKTVKERLIQDPQHAVVIPAFQLFRQCYKYKDCRDRNIPQMPKSLQGLAKMIKEKRGHIFDPTNKGGHGSTDYNAWFKQKPGSLRDIECLQSNRYEPFVAIRYCRDMPPFQQAFSGYGKNKVTWMMQVIASGYTLSQLGGIYLVHYPHLESASRAKWNEAPQELQIPVPKSEESDQNPPFQVRRPTSKDGDLHFEEYKRGQVDKIFLDFKDWLAQSFPPSRARLRLCEAAQDDDSKLWVGPDVKEVRQKQQ